MEKTLVLRDDLDKSYYQKLHDENPAYQRNNWLLAEIDTLVGLGGRSIMEVGCGNGLFLEQAATRWAEVVGLDWARSPRLEEVLRAHPNVVFRQEDLIAARIDEPYDIVVSADVLEHVAADDLPRVLTKLLSAGRINFHKIACYDDGHSHLTVMPPEDWLRLWNAQPGGGSMRLLRDEPRKGDPNKRVAVIFNG